MARTRSVAACVWLAVLACAAPAAAQDLLDRVVGRSPADPLVEITGITAHDIGALAAATGVPMGLERLPGPPFLTGRSRLRLTGRTLRDALRVLSELDPQYEWREIGGVIVFRPTQAWDDPANPLRAETPALKLGEISARAGLMLAAALLGGPKDGTFSFTDTKRFVLETNEATVFDLLNAIVRAHGELAWVFEPSARQNDARFAYVVTLMNGPNGLGIGVPGRPPAAGVDLSRIVPVRSRTIDGGPVLDRIVGPKPSGYPLMATGPSAWQVKELAAAVGVPMGVEVVPLLEPRWAAAEFKLTGLTLREALDALVAVEPRYEWREMNGVIVFRTSAAWRDPGSPLFALTPDLRLDEVPTSHAVGAVLTALGSPPNPWTSFPDTKRLSLDVPPGTALDLLNALLRAHGELVWELTQADADVINATGLRHQLMFSTFGGNGLGVPVR